MVAGGLPPDFVLILLLLTLCPHLQPKPNTDLDSLELFAGERAVSMALRRPVSVWALCASVCAWPQVKLGHTIVLCDFAGCWGGRPLPTTYDTVIAAVTFNQPPGF